MRADFGLNGSIHPLKFRPEDGPAVVIRRIPDVRAGISCGMPAPDIAPARISPRDDHAIHPVPFFAG